jgi:hypothetical protein
MVARAFLILPFLIPVLCGCLRIDDDSKLAKLQAENRGVVLMHTSLLDVGWGSVNVTIAKPDASGHYVVVIPKYPLRKAWDPSEVLGQIPLSAGEYGIVEIYAQGGGKKLHYVAPVVKFAGISDPLNIHYERSIATFRVAAGEVVDIGSLQVIEGEIGKTVFGKPIRGFAAAVTQIPEPWLQSLAENSPYLFKARILRPMSLPAQI